MSNSIGHFWAIASFIESVVIKARILLGKGDGVNFGHLMTLVDVFDFANDFSGGDEVLFRHIFERLSGFFDGDTVGEGRGFVKLYFNYLLRAI